MPVHATAAGKALVAYDSDDEFEEAVARRTSPLREATRTNVDDLIKEVALVRERGVCTDLEEFEEGLRCIGAPCATIPQGGRRGQRLRSGATGLPTRGSPPWSARSSIGREALSARLGFRE